MENPFVYQGYESPSYFCDRTEETENILSALRNGRNITLISPRKIGKTGLISHTFHHILEQESDVDGRDVLLAQKTFLSEHAINGAKTPS